MKLINLLLALLCLLLVPFVMGAVTHSGVLPADLYQTTSTSIDFKWNLTSTLDDVLTSYLYITNQSNESQFLLNATNSSCVNNTQCGLTVSGFNEGFYQWNINSTDDNGTINVSTSVRWFEIRSVANETYFNWKNDSGFLAMTLNKDTGALWTAGNITTVFTMFVNSSYFWWNGTYLNWIFGDIYLQSEIELMNTSTYSYIDSQDTAFNDSMKTYVDTLNDSMKTYVDAQDDAYNTSMKTYVDGLNDSMVSYVDTQDTALGNRISDVNLTKINTADEGTLNVNGSNYWDNFNVASDLNYNVLSDCSNISGNTSDLCTLTDTDTNTNCSTSGGCTTVYQGTNLVLDAGDESSLDVNSSNHLNDFNTTTLENDPSNDLTVKQSWLESLFYTITQIEGFNTSLYGIFYTQEEVEVINSSFIDQNTSDHISFTTGNLSGNLTWTDLYGFPAACPANTAVTQLDDSVTCTDSWLNSAGNEIVTNEVNFTGNVTSNRYYAEIWFHNDTGDGEVTIINTQGVYENLTGFNTSDTAGQKLNGFSWNNGTEDLTANVAGLYMVIFDVSAGNAGVNTEMQFQTQVNGILQENSDAHRKIGTGGDVGNCGDTAYIDLDVGDIVELVVRNNGGTDNIESFAASVNILRVAD